MTDTQLFLTPDEVRVLTGYLVKSKQIIELKKMGIPFFVNATGRAIIARAIFTGATAAPSKPRKTWQSSVVKSKS